MGNPMPYSPPSYSIPYKPMGDIHRATITLDVVFLGIEVGNQNNIIAEKKQIAIT